MTTSESNTGDPKPGEHEWPKLERRREQPVGVAGYALGAQSPIRTAKVSAVYLIEREAIRLRRRRWQEFWVGSHDDSALSADAELAERPHPAGAQRGDDPLQDYARPPESRQRPPLSRRIGMKVRSLLAYFKGRS
ncbi:MAG: hypothetical protein WBF89_10165 [Steroidobacteraceae bacterium]